MSNYLEHYFYKLKWSKIAFCNQQSTFLTVSNANLICLHHSREYKSVKRFMFNPIARYLPCQLIKRYGGLILPPPL